MRSQLRIVSSACKVISFGFPGPTPIPYRIPGRFSVVKSQNNFCVICRKCARYTSRTAGYSPIPRITHSGRYPAACNFPAKESASGCSPSCMPPAISLFAWSPATSINGVRSTFPFCLLCSPDFIRAITSSMVILPSTVAI